MRFSDKVALVTGAGSGIGEAARLFGLFASSSRTPDASLNFIS